MTKPTVILLVMILCLWACGSSASPHPVFWFGFQTQVSISNGASIYLMIPPIPGVPTSVFGPLSAIQGGDSAEPEEPEDPDPEPMPVRPDLQGDLTGEGSDPPPPPP
jgi:hypothetical protein